MNLVEAIKSGKPFRRPEFPPGKWYSYPPSVVIMRRSDGAQYSPDKEDILADDWEVQEPTVSITRAQFDNAYEQAKQEEFDASSRFGYLMTVGPGGAHWSIVPRMRRILGLEPAA